jgi:predicted nuclease of predicted toxin-antitoxin system
MKFLIDAQLPVRLSHLLNAMGHDAIHTKELALKNATPDIEMSRDSVIVHQ